MVIKVNPAENTLYVMDRRGNVLFEVASPLVAEQGLANLDYQGYQNEVVHFMKCMAGQCRNTEGGHELHHGGGLRQVLLQHGQGGPD